MTPYRFGSLPKMRFSSTVVSLPHSILETSTNPQIHHTIERGLNSFPLKGFP